MNLESLSVDRASFAAHRQIALQSADAVIGPAVTRALKRFPNGQWWTPILDAAERVFRRAFRAETGDNKHPDLDREVEQFRNELQANLMATSGKDKTTHDRITKWVATAALNAGTDFAIHTTGDLSIEREWVTMHDDHVRTSHRNTDGQRQATGGLFTVGPDDHGGIALLRYPGDPRGPIGFWIHCRCVLRPVASARATGGTVSTALAADATAEVLDVDPIPWHGVLAPEGVWSGDKRRFKTESLRWRDLPLPLTWQKVSDDGHKGGVTVARIDRIFRDGNLIKGEGVWDTSEDAGEALRQNAEGFLRGVSVDVDDHTAEMAEGEDGATSMTFTSGRICGATLVGIPAFQEAFVQLGTWDQHDEEPPILTEDPEPVKPEVSQDGEGEALTADTDEFIATSTFISEKAWDGSPGRFTDEQYYQSCVLHKNGTSRAKSDNSLPIKEPNGELSRSAVHSAAGMIGKVKGASPEQIASAKRALRGAYKMLGEDPPDSLQGAGEFGRGPGWATNPEGTRRLHDYWVSGPGAAKINWGVPGDFNRCRAQVGEEIGENSPDKLRFLNQICAQWHHDALGYWPGRPTGAETDQFEENEMEPSVNLVASAADVTHRSEFFENPNLVMPSPLVVSREGRVFGHLATWNECHIGIGDRCVTAPHSATDYAYFKTGSVLTDKGEVSVGHISLGGGHADANLGFKAASDHYDSTSAVTADVTCGEDEFGIWVSGQVRPGTTDEQIAAMRAAPLSGDWRKIGSNLELVAALSVNVPGFPIPRPALAASGQQMLSLTAAGVLEPSHDSTLASAVVDEIERRDRERRMARLRSEHNKRRMLALAASAKG
jgi:hypothetical protein